MRACVSHNRVRSPRRLIRDYLPCSTENARCVKNGTLLPNGVLYMVRWAAAAAAVAAYAAKVGKVSV